MAEPPRNLVLRDFELLPRDDDEIEVAIGAGQDLNTLFAALSASGIRVTSLRNKANRLEELFLRLVDKPAGGKVVS